MSDIIRAEIEGAVQTPPMFMDKCFLYEHVSIEHHLNTKQIIRLTSDEVQYLKDNYDIPDVETLHNFPEESTSFSNINDGYGISEWFGDSGLYVPSPAYLKYIQGTHPNIMINAYDLERINIPIPEIMSKLKKNVAVGQLDLPTVSEVAWTQFEETRYTESNRISKYMYPFPVISVNLPYEFYSVQMIPENIYTYDVDSGKFAFAGYTEDEFMELFNQICTSGIRKHLFMQIEKGKIVSADDETYLRLLIADYLKLPTIPVTLYMMNNDGNGLLMSDRPIDVINRKLGTSVATADQLRMINDLTAPHMVFYVPKVNDDVITSINTNEYTTNKEIGDGGIEAMDDVDLHFTADPMSIEDLGIPATDAEVEKIHQQLQAEENQKIESQIHELIDGMNI